MAWTTESHDCPGALPCSRATRQPCLRLTATFAAELPLGGLREVIERPDKVRAVLAGDRSGDDLAAELARRGWDGGVPWDGKAWIVPT